MIVTIKLCLLYVALDRARERPGPVQNQLLSTCLSSRALCILLVLLVHRLIHICMCIYIYIYIYASY